MFSDKDKRLIRLLQIILIMGQGCFCAEDFAAEQGCSLRTIYRDINALEQAGFPIVKKTSKVYNFMKGFNLSKLF